MLALAQKGIEAEDDLHPAGASANLGDSVRGRKPLSLSNKLRREVTMGLMAKTPGLDRPRSPAGMEPRPMESTS